MFPLSDQTKLPGLAAVTFLLVAAFVYVFYLELSAVDLENFILKYSLVPAKFEAFNPSTWFPLVSSQFLHGGWFHLVSNAWFLLIFGPNMERAWGSLRFLVYYLGAGVAASLLQILFVGNISVPMLGASGAIAGVLGAYFVYFPHHKINTFVPLGFVPLFIGIPAGIVLLYWFGLQLVGGLYIEPEASGGVAFFAHIGGFLTGVVLALATKMKNVS